MEPKAVFSVYAEEVDSRANTRLLINNSDQMVYQVDGEEGNYHRVELFLHYSSIGNVFPDIWKTFGIQPILCKKLFSWCLWQKYLYLFAGSTNVCGGHCVKRQ